MGYIIRLVVDLHIDQVSEKNSLMAVSERQMSGKGCTVREGLRTLKVCSGRRLRHKRSAMFWTLQTKKVLDLELTCLGIVEDLGIADQFFFYLRC